MSPFHELSHTSEEQREINDTIEACSLKRTDYDAAITMEHYIFATGTLYHGIHELEQRSLQLQRQSLVRRGWQSISTAIPTPIEVIDLTGDETAQQSPAPPPNDDAPTASQEHCKRTRPPAKRQKVASPTQPKRYRELVPRPSKDVQPSQLHICHTKAAPVPIERISRKRMAEEQS